MACPHSSQPGCTPENCSQCLAYDAREVVIDAQGIVQIDGIYSGRLADLNKQKYLQETANIGPSQGRKRCSVCQRPGHNARSCRVRIGIQSRVHAEDLPERVVQVGKLVEDE